MWPSAASVKWVKHWRMQKTKAVLVLDAKGDLVDVRKPDPLRQVRGEAQPPATLLSLVAALRKAATDDQVAAVFLRIGGLMCPMSRVEELREAVRSASQAKPIIGYMVAGGELEIALGASCSELHISPGGYASLSGFAQRSVLLRGLLQTVGLEPEVSQIGPWKGGHVLTGDPVDGAGEPREVKEQTVRMLEEQRRRYIDGVVSDIGRRSPELDASQIRSAFTALLSNGVMGHALASSQLFSSIRYEDEVACEVLVNAAPAGVAKGNQAVLKKHKPAVLWLTLPAYTKSSASNLGLEGYAKKTAWYKVMVGSPKTPTVGILHLTGQIFFGDGARSNTPRIFHEPVVAALRAAAERKDIASVVIRIDSPGGDALASELIWRAVGILGNEKPVVASMGSVAASGGYFIPMACDQIYAQPSTITGSIGVISARFSSEALLGTHRNKHLRTSRIHSTNGQWPMANASSAHSQTVSALLLCYDSFGQSGWVCGQMSQVPEREKIDSLKCSTRATGYGRRMNGRE